MIPKPDEIFSNFQAKWEKIRSRNPYKFTTNRNFIFYLPAKCLQIFFSLETCQKGGNRILNFTTHTTSWKMFSNLYGFHQRILVLFTWNWIFILNSTKYHLLSWKCWKALVIKLGKLTLHALNQVPKRCGFYVINFTCKPLLQLTW